MTQRHRHKRRTFPCPDEEWSAFLARNHSGGGAARLRELIRMDLAGKIPPETTTAPGRRDRGRVTQDNNPANTRKG